MAVTNVTGVSDGMPLNSPVAFVTIARSQPVPWWRCQGVSFVTGYRPAKLIFPVISVACAERASPEATTIAVRPAMRYLISFIFPVLSFRGSSTAELIAAAVPTFWTKI